MDCTSLFNTKFLLFLSTTTFFLFLFLFLSFTSNTPLFSQASKFQVPSTFQYSSNPINVDVAREEEFECNIYDGRWVYDPVDYPLYKSSKCPFLDEQVTCQENGRKDSHYQHWRWEPNHCTIKRLNGARMMELLKGKRVVFVGDSLNRNMWASLCCLLYGAMPPSRAAADTPNNSPRIFQAKDCNCSVELYFNPFLVDFVRGKDGAKTVLNLDQMPEVADGWVDSDILVFNTGHWWTHTGKFRNWDFFQYNGKLLKHMERDVAFSRGIKTWAKWVESNVHPSRTTVFFRSVSPEHKGESFCQGKTDPMTNETYTQLFPKSMVDIVEKAIKEMEVKVKYLNITALSSLRKDAHPAMYNKKRDAYMKEEKEHRKRQADCSHWCLPGVPDTWNVLMLASMLHNIQVI